MNTGHACRGNPKQANKNTQQNHSPGGGRDHLSHEFTTEDGRNECSKCGTQSQHHCNPERQSQISNGESERKAADSPQKPEEESPEQNCCGCFGKNCP